MAARRGTTIEVARRALEDLESRGIRPTCRTLGEALGIGRSCAHELLQRLVGRSAVERNRGRVRRALEAIRKDGRAATLSAVARESGLGRTTTGRHLIAIRGKLPSQPPRVDRDEFEARLLVMRHLHDRLRRRPTSEELDHAFGNFRKGA